MDNPKRGSQLNFKLKSYYLLQKTIAGLGVCGSYRQSRVYKNQSNGRGRQSKVEKTKAESRRE